MPMGIRVTDELTQISDFALSNIQHDQVLAYNSSINKWINKFINASSEVSKTFTYDGNGRLYSIVDSSGSKIFAYDGNGRLSGITGSGVYNTKSFTYDGNGNLTGITIL